MNDDDLERRLRAFGEALDAAGEDAAGRRIAGRPLAGVTRLSAARSSRWRHQALAAAAAVVVVAAGVITTIFAMSPSDGGRSVSSVPPTPAVVSTEAAPVATLPESTEDATTSTATSPSTSSTAQPTAASTTTAPAANPTTTGGTAAGPAPTEPPATTRPPRCPTYNHRTTYHFVTCDRGPAVYLIQQALRAEVAPQLGVDGLFGPGTEQAVRDFQRQRGLRVDGQVGPETWVALVPDAPGDDIDGSGIVDPDEIVTP